MKCSTCRQALPLSAFSRCWQVGVLAPGRVDTCKPCRARARRLWRTRLSAYFENQQRVGKLAA